jgi:hypothetical protein
MAQSPTVAKRSAERPPPRQLIEWRHFVPLESRSSSSQIRAIGIGIGVLALAVAATVLFFQSAGDGRAPVTMSDQTDDFTVGFAQQLADSIAEDGPLLFSDVSGRGQNRPVYLVHASKSPVEGWRAFSAKGPGAPDGCFLRWIPADDHFTQLDSEDRVCADGTYGSDGQPEASDEQASDEQASESKPLVPYPVTVTGDGEEASVVIHLGYEGRTSVPPDVSQPQTSTTESEQDG